MIQPELIDNGSSLSLGGFGLDSSGGSALNNFRGLLCNLDHHAVGESGIDDNGDEGGRFYADLYPFPCSLLALGLILIVCSWALFEAQG